MKNNLILDVENLLCKKEVILSKDEILQVALFAIQNEILKFELMDFENQNICFSQSNLANHKKRIHFNDTDTYINII